MYQWNIVNKTVKEMFFKYLLEGYIAFLDKVSFQSCPNEKYPKDLNNIYMLEMRINCNFSSGKKYFPFFAVYHQKNNQVP